LPPSRWQVLGANLKCSESGGRGSAAGQFSRKTGAPQVRFRVKSSDFASQVDVLQTRWPARARRVIEITRDDTRQRHQRGAGKTVAAQSSGAKPPPYNGGRAPPPAR
jgi:hypothetical protein